MEVNQEDIFLNKSSSKKLECCLRPVPHHTEGFYLNYFCIVRIPCLLLVILQQQLIFYRSGPQCVADTLLNNRSP